MKPRRLNWIKTCVIFWYLFSEEQLICIWLSLWMRYFDDDYLKSFFSVKEWQLQQKWSTEEICTLPEKESLNFSS